MEHTCHPEAAHHSPQAKKNMISRLSRIEGQIRGISRMIDNDVYCDDVLHQFMAVDAALKGVKNQLLEAHMKSCVVEQIRDGRDEVIDELLVTIKKMTK
ncbi:MAG: metal-sensitive transcriptional regulator [Sphaerochaetaceae bacterium]|nr:metal-sensitive transcriptional regulator [Sphaerochaetaceae bacterium]